MGLILHLHFMIRLSLYNRSIKPIISSINGLAHNNQNEQIKFGTFEFNPAYARLYDPQSKPDISLLNNQNDTFHKSTITNLILHMLYLNTKLE